MANVYYNRVLSDKMVNTIKDSKYSWIIDYVRQHPELDFQTGSNKNKTWFSVYRGTGRVLSLSPRGKMSAANAYMVLCPEFYKAPDEDKFNKLLDTIPQNENLGRYYENNKGTKKEGYYQGMIGRRYTFENKASDDFIIIDKEFVIGFEGKEEKEEWNKPIENKVSELIRVIRDSFGNTNLPSDISNRYGEFDFLGLTWDGDLIIMELKQDDPTKTYLSPLQIAYYNLQLTQLIQDIGLDNLYSNIKEMIEQKSSLGILNISRPLPEKLSGNILNYLIVGDEEDLSDEICRRFHIIRKLVGLEIKAYTCQSNTDGTLKDSIKLINK